MALNILAITYSVGQQNSELIYSGKPQQNAFIERFNRTVRYDWLEQYLFNSIDQVQNYASKWLWHYNHERPNMALGGITPKQKLMNHSLVDPSTFGCR